MQNYGVRPHGESDDEFERIPEGKNLPRKPPPFKPGDENLPLTEDERATLAIVLHPERLSTVFGEFTQVAPENLPEIADMAMDAIGTGGRYVNPDLIVGKLQRLTLEQRKGLLDSFV